MNTSNGSRSALPEGAVLATLAAMEQASTDFVHLPAASKRIGQDLRVKIRVIRRADWIALMPPLPPDARSWPENLTPEERGTRTQDWLDTLPTEDRAERSRLIAGITYGILVLGLADPRVTEDQARTYFALDAEHVAMEILYLSDLATRPAEEQEQEAQPAAEPAAS